MLIITVVAIIIAVVQTQQKIRAPVKFSKILEILKKNHLAANFKGHWIIKWLLILLKQVLP